MKSFLEFIKTTWTAFVGYAIWVLGLANDVVPYPPQISYHMVNGSFGASKFAIAAVTAILFIPILRSKSKAYKLWFNWAIGVLVVIIFFALVYKFTYDNFSVDYYDQSLVKGSVMFPRMEQKRDSLSKARHTIITDEEFVKMCQGKVETIWPEDELITRFYVLSLGYDFIAVLIGIFIVCIAQSIRCYSMKV